MASITHTPVALAVPFDNATNGFTATETQSAIEEARTNAASKSRYALMCAFDGTASTGRYLEVSKNVPSDATPFVIPVASKLREISISSSNSATVTVTIYINGVVTVLDTISIAAARTAIKSGLNHTLNAGTTLAVKVTSGSSSRPVVFLFIQSEA